MSLNYESLADVLAAVENLKKASLISLAQAHSITFVLKCTITVADFSAHRIMDLSGHLSDDRTLNLIKIILLQKTQSTRHI